MALMLVLLLAHRMDMSLVLLDMPMVVPTVDWMVFQKVETMVDPLVPSTVVMTVASLGLQLVVPKVGLMVGKKVALLV